MKLNLPERARILVTRVDRIGDFVLSTPVLEALRQKFPAAYIAVLTFTENRDLIAGNPYIDEALFYDKKGSEKGWRGNFLFARKLAQKKFDIVIHLHATNRIHLVGFLAGIPIRIGWKRKTAWALTHGYEDIKVKGEKHESEYNFDLLEILDVPCPAKLNPFFSIQPKAASSLAVLMQRHNLKAPFIVLNPTASCPSKMWPFHRFADLARDLWLQCHIPIVITGGSGDSKIADQIQAKADIPIIDLTGQLSLAMLGCLLKEAVMLISNDTGPVHIAAAVGTPVVSIFGRNQPGLSPRRWKPLGDHAQVVWKDVGCQPCLAHDCHIGFLCLDVVTVEDVLSAIDELMQQPSCAEKMSILDSNEIRL